jgi:hypothetical protein
MATTPANLRTPKPVTFLTMNCFLLPQLTVTEANSTCTKQDIRAAQIGQFASQWEIVSLQEMWGSNVDKVQAPLDRTHQIPSEYQSVSLFGLGASIFDTARFYLGGTGGLWTAVKKVRERLVFHFLRFPSPYFCVDHLGYPTLLHRTCDFATVQ